MDKGFNESLVKIRFLWLYHLRRAHMLSEYVVNAQANGQGLVVPDEAYRLFEAPDLIESLKDFGKSMGMTEGAFNPYRSEFDSQREHKG